MLGTNGPGFFNGNSAHPFENPTPLPNLLQIVLIFLIPAGLTYTFGVMTGDRPEQIVGRLIDRLAHGAARTGI
jgi:potassium-transporting ATPase potassium-binding subunit